MQQYHGINKPSLTLLTPKNNPQRKLHFGEQEDLMMPSRTTREDAYKINNASPILPQASPSKWFTYDQQSPVRGLIKLEFSKDETQKVTVHQLTRMSPEHSNRKTP